MFRGRSPRNIIQLRKPYAFLYQTIKNTHYPCCTQKTSRSLLKSETSTSWWQLLNFIYSS
ncbi:MAG: hypothetical protein D6742_11485 [Cyanobacteria bacterium J069]|nr:MAG: hypothetical protein D6742_11485 [Cyanobacteria bacterium J069]